MKLNGHSSVCQGDRMVSPEGLEPPTSDLEGRCSIQLSYGLGVEPGGARNMVGAVGFELTTTWSQTRCATRLRYAPMV